MLGTSCTILGVCYILKDSALLGILYIWKDLTPQLTCKYLRDRYFCLYCTGILVVIFREVGLYVVGTCRMKDYILKNGGCLIYWQIRMRIHTFWFVYMFNINIMLKLVKINNINIILKCRYI